MLYSSDNQLNFLNNLCNICDVCDYCAPCRPLSLNFTRYLYSVIRLPDDLPVFVEEPRSYIPGIPACDLVIAVNIHPDLLLELPDILSKVKVKAVIAPADSPDWVPPGLKRQLQEMLKEYNMEYAFPKPYCSLHQKKEHPFINQVITQLRIGTPKVDIEVKRGAIHRATCLRSAPCGSTWYVCENLKNVLLTNVIETISEAHHAFPCNASMVQDPEINDTLLHKAGYLVREAVVEALKTKGIDLDLG